MAATLAAPELHSIGGPANAAEFAKRAIEQLVAFVPGAPFYPHDPDPATLRLSFATAGPDKIREGVARLAQATSRHALARPLPLLVELGDGQTVESVLLAPGRIAGLCVSTQVGCAVGCVFCMTGQGGLLRQLGSAEIVAQVALARRLRPGVPVFSSETYPGWLTHWGEPWAAPSVPDLLKEVTFLLETGKSFNFYVAHGGTNFGFTAGANSGGKGYEPDVTSYDYDAPISEAGWATEKFHLTRDLFAKYLLPGETLPDIPAPLPVQPVVGEDELAVGAPPRERVVRVLAQPHGELGRAGCASQEAEERRNSRSCRHRCCRRRCASVPSRT